MNYKSKRWKTLRARILRRDGYQCRECRRYGKAIQADTVHHVYPASLYPEWSLEPWNLVSLCFACHNAMHDRDEELLTEKGVAWCRRVSPPLCRSSLGPFWGPERATLSDGAENEAGGKLRRRKGNTRAGRGRIARGKRWSVCLTALPPMEGCRWAVKP